MSPKAIKIHDLSEESIYEYQIQHKSFPFYIENIQLLRF